MPIVTTYFLDALLVAIATGGTIPPPPGTVGPPGLAWGFGYNWGFRGRIG